ncbi:MAG: EamA family transporter RarD [Alphaproteobacteria bacterium]|nr:EamA family transporter RarD [Alphaproteobacteria bacterium]
MTAITENLSSQHKGVIYAITAHLFWGTMAAYFGFIRYINPLEIAVHRAVWSVPIGLGVVLYTGLLPRVWSILKSPRLLALLFFTSLLVVFNWTLYIWCITNGHTLDASLGYFINPLLNVAVGFIFLGERFTRPQMVAIGLAVVAVLVVTLGTGVFPFIGLSLAATFCLYGYLRKIMPVGPIDGFLVEVVLTLIPLLAVDYWLSTRGELHFGQDSFSTLMLMGCGLYTAGALLFYSASIKLIRYSTAGLMQYLSPSMVFLTAVFWFGETLNPWKLAGFAIIWCALAIYSWSSLRAELRNAS